MSIIIVLIFILLLALCLFIYYKRNTIKNIYSVITNILTFIITIIFTKLITHPISQSLTPKVVDLIKSSLNISKEEWASSPSLDTISDFFITIVIGIISFILIFTFLYIINHLIKRFVFKHIQKASYQEYSASIVPVNLALGIITFFLITTAYIYPVATVADIVNYGVKETNYQLPKNLKSIARNPIFSLYSNTGSKILFNQVTSISHRDNFTTTDELEGLLTIAFAFANMSDTSNALVIKETMSNTYLIPNFVSDIISTAATRWQNGESFLGKTITIPENKSKNLYIDVLGILSNWERENLIADVDTVFKLYKILDRNKIIEDKKALITAISDNEFNEKLFLCLFDNNDFRVILPTFINYGMSTILEGLNINTDQEFIYLYDFRDMTDEDIKNEARYFTITINLINELKTFNANTVTADDYTRIVNDLAEIKDSKILSSIVYNVIYQLVENIAQVKR